MISDIPRCTRDGEGLFIPDCYSRWNLGPPYGSDRRLWEIGFGDKTSRLNTSYFHDYFTKYLLRKKWGITFWATLLYMRVKKKQSSPATRHGGAWGERRYSSYSFLTSALDGGKWSASRPGHALPRGKDPRYPLYRRLCGPQSRSGYKG
jgi:hypothetical protein